MEAFLVSMVVVAVGEIGDKTQLLALMLAARLKKPLPIILGIVVAILFNHTLAGLLGGWVRQMVPAVYLKWLLAISFLAVAVWALKPDKIDDSAPVSHTNLGAFMVTVVAFFLAEIGDKTQVATVMLAARFDNLVAVVAGTTLGMLIADVPVVLVGKLAARTRSRSAWCASSPRDCSPRSRSSRSPRAEVGPRSSRYNRLFRRHAIGTDPHHASVPPRRNRSRRAGALDLAQGFCRHRIVGGAEVLLRLDAALPVRQAAHGARSQLHHQRHDVPVSRA